MKLYIKNKFWSITGSSKVVDINKNPVYKVKGRFLSPTKVKKVCDLKNNMFYKVRNKYFNWFNKKAYIYDANGEKVATVVHKFFSLKGDFYIEGYKDEIKVEGKFWSLTSKLLKNGVPFGTIRRELNFFVDAFELEANEEDMPFLIALVIAIDNITDGKKSR